MNNCDFCPPNQTDSDQATTDVLQKFLKKQNDQGSHPISKANSDPGKDWVFPNPEKFFDVTKPPTIPKFPSWKSPVAKPDYNSCLEGTQGYPEFHVLPPSPKEGSGEWYVKNWVVRYGIDHGGANPNLVGCWAWIDEYPTTPILDPILYPFKHWGGLDPNKVPQGWTSYGWDWIDDKKRKRHVFGKSVGTTIDKGNFNPEASNAAESYINMLANAITQAWSGFSYVRWDAQASKKMATDAVTYKSKGVNWEIWEKDTNLKNMQKLIQLTISLGERLKQALPENVGTVAKKWANDALDPGFILTVDSIAADMKLLGSKWDGNDKSKLLPINGPNPTPLIPQDKSKLIPTYNPYPSPQVDPFMNLTPASTTGFSWWQEFEVDFDLWATELLLTDSQLLLAFAGLIPVSLYAYQTGEFSFIPFYIIPAFGWKFISSYMETKLAASQSFANFIYYMSGLFYEIKADIDGFSKGLIKAIEFTSLGGFLMVGTTFIGTKAFFLQPYVSLINLGITAVVGIFDLWELLPYLVPKLF